METTILPREVKVTFVPSRLSDDNWMSVLAVRGIATMHNVYVSEDGNTAIYFVSPESGSYSGITRWANSEHDAEKAWNLDSGQDYMARMVKQQAVERWALEQAHAEVIAEMTA